MWHVLGLAWSRIELHVYPLPLYMFHSFIHRPPRHPPALHRGDVHWVVTEYGAAQLWGKTIGQRAAALIDIAHPKFREELREYARERRWL